MASALIIKRNYKRIAEIYSLLNEYQVNQGKNLVKLAGVKREDKVLDVGCGTGEITTFITDQVGEEGEVLGIDPDQERINIALQKHGEAKSNIKFTVGDSSSAFPHHDEEYYDVHYSNFVFHWLTAQEKEVYVKAAFKCLKPGGRIVILSADKCPDLLNKIQELLPDEEIEKNRSPDHYIEKSDAQSMLEKSGFMIHLSEYSKPGFMFTSLDTLFSWYCSSNYIDESKIVPYKKEAYAKKFVNEDGTVYFEGEIYRIIAKKIL